MFRKEQGHFLSAEKGKNRTDTKEGHYKEGGSAVKRPMWIWLIALCGGILLAAGEGIGQQVAGLICGIGCLVVARVQRSKGLAVGIVVLFLAGGLVVALSPKLGSVEGEVSFSGEVLSRRIAEDGRQTVVMELEELYQDGKTWKEKGRVSVYLPEGVSVLPGSFLVVKGTLSVPAPPQNPGGFDSATYARSNGLRYQCFAEDVVCYGTREMTALEKLAMVRERICQVYETVLPAKEASLMAAMVTGSTASLEDGVRQLYNDGGIAHVLAVSGLHTTILAGILFGAFFWMLHLPRRFAMGLVMVCLVVYLFFAGARPSVVRATLMAELVFGAALVGRETDGFHSMGLAGIVLLLLEPYALFTAGFQLSFLTTGAFLFAATYPLDSKDWKGRVKRYLFTTTLVTLLSFPLVAWYFYRLPVYGALVNLLVLPLLGLLLAMGLAVGLVGLFSLELAHFLAGGVYVILRFYDAVTSFFTSLPGAVLLTGRPSIEAMVLFYGLIAFVCLVGMRGLWRKVVWGSMTGLLLWMTVLPVVMPKAEVWFLDVGQGDSSILHTKSGHTFVIDAGGWPLAKVGENTGAKVVAPALEALGFASVDGLFVTHLDRDHALGAVELLSLCSVKRLYLPETPMEGELYHDLLKAAKEQGTEVIFLSAGQEMVLSETEKISVLLPYRVKMWPETDDNRSSLVLKYETGESSLLWMGDADSEAEELLLFDQTPLACDAIKLGHHGSATSSSAAFLADTKAQLAIVSNGENNVYGHPSQETITRCQEAGITVYETAKNGAIHLTSKETGWHLEGSYHETTEGRTEE